MFAKQLTQTVSNKVRFCQYNNDNCMTALHLNV